MSLIEGLVSQLGVSNTQAEGGVGLLFKMAKEHLSEGDFSQVADLIPGLGEMIGKAPEAAPAAEAEGGLTGMLGGLASAVGLGEVVDKIGGLSTLLEGFKSLDLDEGMLGGFVSAILAWVKEHGGEQIESLLKGVLK